MIPAPTHIQPYHPGLATVQRSASSAKFPVYPGSQAERPRAISRRFIKDADFASGATAFFDKSVHKRAKGLPDSATTAFRVNNFSAKVPPKLPHGVMPTQQIR